MLRAFLTILGVLLPSAAVADTPSPIDVLKDTTKVWRYEVVRGPSLLKLTKVKGAPNVWCSIATSGDSAPTKIGELNRVRMMCKHDGKPAPGAYSLGGPVGVIADTSFYLVFGPDFVKSPDYGAGKAKSLAESGNVSGMMFPRRLKGKRWKHTGTTGTGATVEVVVRQTSIPVLGSKRKVWVSEGKYWGKGVKKSARPGSVFLDALLPGVGPALICTELGPEGGAREYWCNRLVSVDK